MHMNRKRAEYTKTEKGHKTRWCLLTGFIQCLAEAILKELNDLLYFIIGGHNLNSI